MRLVASDLDGTLLRTDGTVSSRTRAALGAAQAAGVVVVLVTGRPPRWMTGIVDETGVSGLAVCANGALVYDLDRGEVVRQHHLAPVALTRLVDELRQRLPDIAFAVETATGLGHEAAFGRRYTGEAQVATIDELIREPVIKLIVQQPGRHPEEIYETAVEVAGTDAVVTFSGDHILEISAAGVSKAFTLAALADEVGLGPDDAVAFGDMPNDVPMLEWAGHGVAVANAHPRALAVADEVTASNDDDGVALVVERMLG